MRLAWIELHQTVFTHRKTILVSELLDIPEVHVAGHMAALWCWALDNAPTGHLGRSARLVAKAAQWTADAQTFVDALATAVYLDQDAEGWSIHNWSDYAGRLIDQRERAKERTKAWRAQRNSNVTIPNADVTHNVDVRYDATQPNRTVPKDTESRASVLCVQGLQEEERLEAEGAFGMAHRAGYDADEINQTLSEFVHKGRSLVNCGNYLIGTLKGRRTAIANGKAPAKPPPPKETPYANPDTYPEIRYAK